MAELVKVGQTAPDFTNPGVVGEDERDFSVSEYRGRQNVLVFFYVYDWTGL